VSDRTPDTPRELNDWLDEIVTDAGFADLDAWLAAEPAHARQLLELAIVHHGIPAALPCALVAIRPYA
jgi:hypothetical protein